MRASLRHEGGSPFGIVAAGETSVNQRIAGADVALLRVQETAPSAIGRAAVSQALAHRHAPSRFAR
jgi:hypothetical protein